VQGHDPAVGIEEGDVDRGRAVAHHHREGLRLRQHEEHAGVARDLAPTREPALARRRVEGELEREGLAAEGEAEDLMPETDAEHRDVRLHQLADVADGVLERRRIAGAVAEKDAVRLDRQQIHRRHGSREDVDVAAVRVEPPQDVPLHAEVVRGHLQAASGVARRRQPEFRMRRIAARGRAVSPLERGVAGHARHEIRPFHLRDRARLFHELVRVHVAGGDDAAHDAARTQHARERARVDVGDRDDVVADEIVVKRTVGAPVAGERRGLAHDEARDVRHLRLGVAGRDAVIANLRRGHRHDLSRVRRIGEHFLVAGHARVEHDFTARFTVGACRDAAVPGAVFECKNCVHSSFKAQVTRLKSQGTTRWNL